MIYERDGYQPQNIFETVELVNQDMEDESGIVFYHSLDASVSTDKAGIPHIEWALLDNETQKLAKIGEYKGDDVSFMKRFLAAHRVLFEGKLKKDGLKKPRIEQEYKRWHNRAMRSVAGPSELDLLEAQVDLLDNKFGTQDEVGRNTRHEIRRFELINKAHRKYWTIQKLVGGRARSFVVCFGRIPEGKRPPQLEKDRGQVQTKTFKTSAACNEAYENLIFEKLKKGYQETLHTFANS